MNGVSETPRSSQAPSFRCGHGEKTLAMNRDAGPHQNMMMLAP